MNVRIRFAQPSDAAAIQAIYAPNVESSAISFELVPPSVEEMAARLARISAQYPWLVCEMDGRVTGYVYACQHRERAAYRWSVDVTVYIDAAFRRRGIARALYTSLLEILQLQGYAKAFAGITLPNAGSVGVHEAVGFKPAAVFRRVGHKMGAWRDVGWWEMNLHDREEEPAEAVAISALVDSPEVADALKTGADLLRNA
jgi:L-amino acid N-acyltransferase YncA